MASPGPSLDESAVPGASLLAGSASLPAGLSPVLQTCPSSPALAAGTCGSLPALLLVPGAGLRCPARPLSPPRCGRAAPACPPGLDAAPGAHPAAQGRGCVHTGLHRAKSWLRSGSGAGRVCLRGTGSSGVLRGGCTLPGGGKGVRKQNRSCALSPAGTCLPCEPAVGWSCVSRSLGPWGAGGGHAWGDRAPARDCPVSLPRCLQDLADPAALRCPPSPSRGAQSGCW